MGITVNHSVTARMSVSGGTLGELKELIQTCENAGLKESARVLITQTPGNQREQTGGSNVITVTA